MKVKLRPWMFSSLLGPVVWVNFGGALLTKVSPGQDDAPNGKSELAGTQFPAFDGSKVAPGVSAADAQEAVFDRLRGYYLPYDVGFTTTQPSPPYSMIVVGGTPGLAGQPSSVGGVAPIDCTNANGTNIAFAFADEYTPLHGGPVALAMSAAHELGHSFGLEHVDNPMDVMFYADPSNPAWNNFDVFSLAFTQSASFSPFNAGSSEPSTELCGRANPLNDDQILKTALGASTVVDRSPPSLTWTAPPLDFVDATFGVSFDATDDVGVVKIEIYKEDSAGIGLVGVLRQAPYATTLSASPGTFRLVAEAVDAAGNRTSKPRDFTTTPILDDFGAPIDDLGQPNPSPDLAMAPVASGGCSFATR